MNDDEQRWADAGQILQGTPDESVRRRISRRRTRLVAIAVGAMVVCTALGAATGWVLAARHDGDPVSEPSSVPTWVAVVGFGVLLLGLLIGAAGLFRLNRTGNWRWKTPASPLSRAQKRSLHRQLIGKAPVDPDRLPLTRDLARRVTQQRPILVVFGGFLVTQLGSAIISPGVWRFALLAVLVVTLGLAAALMERDIRRARTFLEQNPLGPPD